MPKNCLRSTGIIPYGDEERDVIPEVSLVYAIMYRGLADFIMYNLYLYHGMSYHAHPFSVIKTSVWWIKQRYSPYSAYTCCAHTGVPWKDFMNYVDTISANKENEEYLIKELGKFRV